jgi:hypothetical protein
VEATLNSPQPHFRRGDIPAVFVAVAVAALFLYAYFKHADWQRASGFGPEWQCTQPGRAGSSFCIKKSAVDSSNQAKTQN